MSKAEAIAFMRKVRRESMKGSYAEEAYEMAIEALKERPTGKWIDRSDGGRILYPWWENCECSQCGEYGSGAYDFCPHCGSYNGGEER